MRQHEKHQRGATGSDQTGGRRLEKDRKEREGGHNSCPIWFMLASKMAQN